MIQLHVHLPLNLVDPRESWQGHAFCFIGRQANLAVQEAQRLDELVLEQVQMLRIISRPRKIYLSVLTARERIVIGVSQLFLTEQCTTVNANIIANLPGGEKFNVIGQRANAGFVRAIENGGSKIRLVSGGFHVIWHDRRVSVVRLVHVTLKEYITQNRKLWFNECFFTIT